MIREDIRRFDLKLKKSLGQNFLADRSVLKRIAGAAELEKSDLVLEIGTGLGNLTELIAEKAGHVITVEKDTKTIEAARECLKRFDNITLVNEDIRKMFIGKELKKHPGFKSRKVVANIPYYITTPIICMLLEGDVKFDLIVFTIQKEVAERITAKPGGKDYGSLTVMVNYYSKPTIVLNVSRYCFVPRPKVDSAVIKLEVLKEPAVQVRDEELFFRIVNSAFMQRRKMLRNAINNANIPGVDKEKIDMAMKAAGIDGNRRGETLSLQEFAKLADSFMV